MHVSAELAGGGGHSSPFCDTLPCWSAPAKKEMCSSYFSWQSMEHSNRGDLGDIIRASYCRGAPPSAGHRMMITSNQQQSPPEPPSLLSPPEGPNEEFGDPFSDHFRNPLLLRELADTTSFHSRAPVGGLVDMSMADDDGGGGGDSTKYLVKQNTHIGVVEMKRPCNIFSRVVQNPPVVKASSMISPRGIRPSPVLAGGMVKANNRSAGCPPDKGELQITSSRNPGIKRRKNLAKVVCIPAPAAASSRPSGEVVPSDLWSWRKYGQKPIKGSPYPRGYYRCSSSKGCSARKQVERSRSDPNMLVITYTSEHNHPWPTQRNALAGSTRSQTARSSASSAPKSSPLSQRPKDMVEEDHHLDHALCRIYEPMLPETRQSDDLFADLGEFESDPMSLVFSKLLGDKPVEESESGTMDPFGCLDWAGSSFGETRKGV